MWYNKNAQIKNTKNLFRLIIVLVFFNLYTTEGFSQNKIDGFYKGQGNMDFVLGGGIEGAANYFAGYELVGLGRLISNVNFFYAVGATDWFDINLSVPFVMISSSYGLQDGSLYLKFRLFEKEMDKGKLSLTVAPGFSRNLTNYQTEGFSAIGQQATTFDLRPLVHFQWNSGWFITGQSSYLYRLDPVPPSVNGGLKVGYAAANYYYDFWIDHQTSFGGLDYQGTPAPTTFRELGVDYTKIGGTFYTPIKKRWGFFAGASFVVFGRNVGQGAALNLGFVFKVKPE